MRIWEIIFLPTKALDEHYLVEMFEKVNIKQSNELTEAAYYLSLQAKRVLWLMQAYFSEASDLMYCHCVSDYIKYFNVATAVASRDVKALGESPVPFYPSDGEFE